jgi:hypothetical protein
MWGLFQSSFSTPYPFDLSYRVISLFNPSYTAIRCVSPIEMKLKLSEGLVHRVENSKGLSEVLM